MSASSPKNFHTPVKRLGLSRKKPSPSSPLVKDVLHRLHCAPSEPATFTPNKLRTSLPELTEKTDEDRVQELQERLSALRDTSELEAAVSLWKTGCKDALIDLKELLTTEEGFKESCQSLAEKLGIGSVMQEHFVNDSDIFDE